MSQQPGGCLDRHEADWLTIGIHQLELFTLIGLTDPDGVVTLTTLHDVPGLALQSRNILTANGLQSSPFLI